MMTKFGAVVAACGLALSCAGTADAAYIVSFQQTAGNVVATGTGTINLTGLSTTSNSSTSALVHPAYPAVLTGLGNYAYYTGSITGPANFGDGGLVSASTSAGDKVGFQNGGSVGLVVPVGYVSGGSLANTSTFNNATLASLGLRVGTYVYSFGTAGDTFTVQVNAPLPEPATWAMTIMGIGAVGWAMRRRRAVGTRVRFA